MPRPRRITDEEILTIARNLLLEHGLNISMRTMAREIGISEGVLFQRFASKDALIRAALSIPVTDADQLLKDANKGENARIALENIAEAILNTFRQLLPLYIPILHHPDFQGASALSSRTSPFRLFVSALEDHLKAERHAGRLWTESPYMASYSIVSALHNAVLMEIISGKVTSIVSFTARDLINVVWPGLNTQHSKN